MILKIEKWVYLPVVEHSGAQDVNDHPLAIQSKRKIFHMIDHVEDVQFGDIVKAADIPHPMPKSDGTMLETEIFMDEGVSGLKEDTLMNIVHFSQGGRGHRTIAVAGTIYLCSDGGDTLEIIRASN